MDGLSRLLAAATAADEFLTPKARSLYRLLLLTAGVLLGVFILTILVVRGLRRYRETYLRATRKPTPSEDVWTQHRLPEDWDQPAGPEDDHADGGQDDPDRPSGE